MPVKVKGATSGSVTVKAPDTGSDVEVTLPAAAGTLLNSDGDGSSLTGVGVDGIVSSANATAITIDSGEHVFMGATSYSGGGNTPLLYVSHSSRQVKIHNPGVGTSMLQITNATTGQGDDNGLHVYMRSTGKAVINNVENNDLAFSTNNTERLLIKNDGRGLSQFTAKAWIDFNGTGTVAIRDSHNVSSLNDSGTGYVYVAYINNNATVNSAVVASVSNSANTYDRGVTTASQVVNNFSVMTFTTSTGSAADVERIYAVVFGD